MDITIIGSDELSRHRQDEIEQRRLGMRSLDRRKIDGHFARAAELRALIAAGGTTRRAFGLTGTKGSSGPR